MTTNQVTIRIDSNWLNDHLYEDEKQYLVFDKDVLRVITVFDELGMVEYNWKPQSSSSACLDQMYTWEIKDLFYSMVDGYCDTINKMNINLNVEICMLTLESAEVGAEHDFACEFDNLSLDTDMTWTLDNHQVIGEGDFDWRDLTLISDIFKHLFNVTVTVQNDNNEVIWEGYNTKRKKVWIHKHKRINWKYGEASTTFRPDIFSRILSCMPKKKSYGSNIKISILQSKLLLLEAKETNGDVIIGYLTPFSEEIGGNVIDTEVPVIN